MTITEFLLARIAEDEDDIHQHQRVLAECKAKRRIIELHKSWPVLVETEPTFETDDSLDSHVMRVSRQMAWLTEREYVARFGTEPPTTPMLLALVQPYADHPDFDPEWRS